MLKLSIFRRGAGLFAALALTATVVAPTAAQAQNHGRLGEVNRQIASYRDVWRGSSLVYFGCEAVAMSAYEQSGYVQDGIVALVACAGLGCTLTGNYEDCLAVNRDLFFLRVEQRILRGY